VVEQDENKHVLVVLKSAPERVEITLSLPGLDGVWVDLISNDTHQSVNGQAHWRKPPNSGQILAKETGTIGIS